MFLIHLDSPELEEKLTECNGENFQINSGSWAC